MRNWKSETGIAKPEIQNKQMRTWKNETGIAKPELRNKKCEPGKTNEIAKPEIRNKKCEWRQTFSNGIIEVMHRGKLAANFLE